MSTVDVAVSDRPVKAETQPLADWVNRECVPILKKLRDAVNAGATPGGAAGGQLGGTYPNPDVRGLRETSGPTELTLGSVSDGQFLKRVGSTVVGGTVTVQSVSIKGFRSRDQGGSAVRVHCAGLNNYSSGAAWFGAANTNTLQSVGAGQMAYAIPEYFEKAGTINRIVSRTNGRTGITAGSRIKMGVYADGTLSSGSFTGSPYPGARMGQTADLQIPSPNTLLETSGLSISVAANSYLWFVWVCNNDAVSDQITVPAYRTGTLWPIIGFTLDVATPTTIGTDSAAGGVGWRHAITYTGSQDLPDPLTQSAPAVTTGADVVLPCIFYGFQAA